MENANAPESNAIPADIARLRLTAAAALREMAPGVRTDSDEIPGGQKNITEVGKLLSPAAADGRVDEVVTRFVAVYRDLFGHGSLAPEPGDFRITTAHHGMKAAIWQQESDGIPVFQTILRARLTKHGDLITLGGNHLGDPATATHLDAKRRAAMIANPPAAPTRAIVLAAAAIDAVVDEKLVAITRLRIVRINPAIASSTRKFVRHSVAVN